MSALYGFGCDSGGVITLFGRRVARLQLSLILSISPSRGPRGFSVVSIQVGWWNDWIILFHWLLLIKARAGFSSVFVFFSFLLSSHFCRSQSRLKEEEGCEFARLLKNAARVAAARVKVNWVRALNCIWRGGKAGCIGTECVTQMS